MVRKQFSLNGLIELVCYCFLKEKHEKGKDLCYVMCKTFIKQTKEKEEEKKFLNDTSIKKKLFLRLLMSCLTLFEFLMSMKVGMAVIL